MSLDDMQLGTTYTIDGYATVTPVETMFVDYFAQFNKDADANRTDWNWAGSNSGIVIYSAGREVHYYVEAGWKDSGVKEDFFWLRMDITNLKMSPVNYMSDEEATVKVVYNDEYEFAGWVRQADFDINSAVFRQGMDTQGAPFAVLDPANEEPVDMMYTGVFIFGATLPNAVVEDKKGSLCMEIKLGDYDLTFNINK